MKNVMFKLHLKNFTRLALAIIYILIPCRSKEKKRLYCNLLSKSPYGGPDRFLKNILNNPIVAQQINIQNWSLKKCISALVFSAAWGKSFNWLCKILKVKSVLRVDGFYVPEDLQSETFKQPKAFQAWLNNRMSYDLKNFNHIIYQSHFSKAVCDEYLFHRTSNYSIIPNGTNLEHFKPIHYKKTDTLKIAILGKHYPKHLVLAMDVLKELKKHHKCKLTIIGPMRDGQDIVKEYCMKLPSYRDVSDSLECAGIVSFNDLPKQLNNIDILLHVKVGDWCPNAVIEALACGVPVVCPSWGGTAELIGDAGIVVKNNKWEYNAGLGSKMASAVLQVYSKIEDYKTCARNHAINNFDINVVSIKYLKILGLIP